MREEIAPSVVTPTDKARFLRFNGVSDQPPSMQGVFMSHNLPPLPQFTTWRRKYAALVCEQNPNSLPKLATELEEALFVRFQELANDATPTTERAAIQKAVRTLRAIQEDKLGYPKWG
jgi:hypothetical protein